MASSHSCLLFGFFGTQKYISFLLSAPESSLPESWSFDEVLLHPTTQHLSILLWDHFAILFSPEDITILVFDVSLKMTDV